MTKTTLANTINIRQVGRSDTDLVGGKGANLGEISRINGIRVPGGFCITTEVYKNVVEQNDAFNVLLDELSVLKAGDKKQIAEISKETRGLIEKVVIPVDIRNEIAGQVDQLGEKNPLAIRSSATTEDLPSASFAGQHDTYLNIIGHEAVLKHTSSCWASLFTERAITYRIQNGFDHRKVRPGVVVQQMVFPQVSGILFTADPVTGNRKVSCIDAGFGLGEALVSGLVSADNYKIREGSIVEKKIATKKLAVYASENGGTTEQRVEPGSRQQQALKDEHIIELERIGRRIEAHFGGPQDIEWCLVDGIFYIVQSRPITTLFPVPELPGNNSKSTEPGNNENRIYISVGHQQMMTDAMKPLGLSFWLLMTPPKTCKAGGRLFVDATPMLAAPGSRNIIINTLGKFDPLVREALTNIINRGDFLKLLPEKEKENRQDVETGATPLPDYQALNEFDPTIVADLIRTSQASLKALKKDIQQQSGPALFDFILEDIGRLKKETTDPKSFGVIMTGMNAASWINEKMNEWLGDKNAADTIAQSVLNNITSEMGLELLDVADVIRAHPEVIAYLHEAKDDNFLRELVKLKGGQESLKAINDYLNKHGMRCVGEIDITKSRWSENPLKLVPLILSNIRNFETGAGSRKFELGLQEAAKKEQELLERLTQLPGGQEKAKETKRMIDLVRNYAGYREYPKYAIVSRFFVYKQAILNEADKLARAGVLNAKEDIYYLDIEELRQVVSSRKIDNDVITQRKEAYTLYKKLNPPRVITSDGEILTGSHNRGSLPPGTIAGLAVSSGVIEGKARVILDLEHADLEEGDILVTTFTDPSWTPSFVSIKGLVTEVGGLMTHGAVIAREYGIPAVVGVDNATRVIRDGDKIRVNGTDGYIEIIRSINMPPDQD
ncbi:phosphoenolpyruvate synthase [Flavitalea antarctica]